MSEHPTAVIDQALARLQGDPLFAFPGRNVVTRVLSVVTRPFSYVARVESESASATRRVIVKIPRLTPGKTVGGWSLLTGDSSSVDVRAMEEASVARLSRFAFEAFSEQFPEEAAVLAVVADPGVGIDEALQEIRGDAQVAGLLL
jgi:CRP-like cAMP-binding protein